MYGLRAGRLREVVTISRPTENQDGYGQAVKTYATVKTIRAAVRQVSGTEIETGGKYEGRDIYEFTLRSESINKTDRLVWLQNNYEIIQIVNVSERDRVLKIRAARYDR